jgi:hypothetical protein
MRGKRERDGSAEENNNNERQLVRSSSYKLGGKKELLAKGTFIRKREEKRGGRARKSTNVINLLRGNEKGKNEVRNVKEVQSLRRALSHAFALSILKKKS